MSQQVFTLLFTTETSLIRVWLSAQHILMFKTQIFITYCYVILPALAMGFIGYYIVHTTDVRVHNISKNTSNRARNMSIQTGLINKLANFCFWGNTKSEHSRKVIHFTWHLQVCTTPFSPMVRADARGRSANCEGCLPWLYQMSFISFWTTIEFLNEALNVCCHILWHHPFKKKQKTRVWPQDYDVVNVTNKTSKLRTI